MCVPTRAAARVSSTNSSEHRSVATATSRTSIATSSRSSVRQLLKEIVAARLRADRQLVRVDVGLRNDGRRQPLLQSPNWLAGRLAGAPGLVALLASDYRAFLRAKDAGKRYFYTANYTGSESVPRPT